MMFLLSFLLIICAHVSWSVSSDALVVTQSPDVSVQEGETGNITCCWKGTERVGIKWLKNQTLIENKTVINQTTGSKNEQKNKCSVLIIENMTKGDSGRYICKVSMEIPVLKEVEGKGTTITVTARENSADHQPDRADQHSLNDVPQEDTVTFILRCLPILALITASFWIYHQGSKAQRDTRVSATPLQSKDEDQEASEGHERLTEGHEGHEGMTEGHERITKGHEGHEGMAEGHEEMAEGHEGHEGTTEGQQKMAEGHEGMTEGHEEKAEGHEGPEGMTEGHEEMAEGHEGHEGMTEGQQKMAEGHEEKAEGHEGPEGMTEGHEEMAEGHEGHEGMTEGQQEMAEGHEGHEEMTEGHEVMAEE